LPELAQPPLHAPRCILCACSDCDGYGWAVPRDALFAIGYWVLLGSVVGYLLLTWGNSLVDASMVGAYFTVQPIGAVLAAAVVISATPGTDHYGLQGLGAQDYGALAIFAGVGVLILDARCAKVLASDPPTSAETDDLPPYERLIDNAPLPTRNAAGTASLPAESSVGAKFRA